MNKTITGVASLTFAALLSACGSDTNNDHEFAAGDVTGATLVDLHGFVYQGQMDSTRVRVDFGYGSEWVAVGEDGTFAVEVPFSSLASGVQFDVQGAIEGQPMALHGRLHGSSDWQTEAQQNGYQLRYHEVPELYVSPLSEAYQQVPTHASGDWLVNYAAAVRMVMAGELPLAEVDLTALAASEQAMTAFADIHSEDGYHSLMAQSIQALENDELLGMNLRDERLLGEFVAYVDQPQHLARTQIASSFRITPDSISVPSVGVNGDGLPQNFATPQAWNRVNNRLFIEDAEQGLNRYHTQLGYSGEDQATRDALIAKFGNTLYPTVGRDIYHDITVISAQPDEVLLRVAVHQEFEGFSFEWQGTEYEIAPRNFEQARRSVRLMHGVDAEGSDRVVNDTEVFEVQANDLWMIPPPSGGAGQIGIRLHGDGRFEADSVTDLPLDAETSPFAPNAVHRMFDSGQWSLENDDRVLRLTMDDASGQVWVYDLQHRIRSEVGEEMIGRLYRQGSELAAYYGGPGQRVGAAVSLDEALSWWDDPVLVSLVNTSSEHWEWGDDALRTYSYFGWWLFDNQTGMVPDIACNGDRNFTPDRCPRGGLEHLGGERIEWSMDNNVVTLQRRQDHIGECTAADARALQCNLTRVIVPLATSGQGNVRGIEYQYSVIDGEAQLHMPPRLMNWLVQGADEFLQRPEYAGEDPDAGEEPPENAYDEVTDARVHVALGAEFAGMTGSIRLGDRVTNFALSSDGVANVVVPVAQAAPQAQVLDFTIEVPNSPLQMRQLSYDYDIVRSDDVGSYLRFEMKPTVWTTAYAYWVDRMTGRPATVVHDLLKVDLSLDADYLLDTATVIAYLLETAPSDWAFSVEDIGALLDSYAGFYERFELVPNATQRRQALLADADLLQDIEAAGLLTGQWSLLRSMPMNRSRVRFSFGLGFDLPQLRFSDLGEPTGNWQPVDVMLDYQDAAIRGVASDWSGRVYDSFDREYQMAELTRHLDVEQRNAAQDAWRAKHDGDNPTVPLQRSRVFSALSLAGRSSEHSIVRVGTKNRSDTFSFEHEGVLYDDLFEQLDFTENMAVVNLERYIAVEETLTTGPSVALDSIPDVTAATVVGSLLVENMQDGLLWFNDNGRFRFELPRQAPMFGDWSVIERTNGLRFQIDNVPGHTEVHPLLSDWGQAYYVHYDNDGAQVWSRMAAYLPMQGDGFGALEASSLSLALDLDYLIADFHNSVAASVWADEYLPFPQGNAIGLNAEGEVSLYATYCDGRLISGFGQRCEGDFELRERFNIAPEVVVNDDSISFSDRDIGDTYLYPIGEFDDTIMYIEMIRDGDGMLHQMFLNYGRLIDREAPLQRFVD